MKYNVMLSGIAMLQAHHQGQILLGPRLFGSSPWLYIRYAVSTYGISSSRKKKAGAYNGVIEPIKSSKKTSVGRYLALSAH